MSETDASPISRRTLLNLIGTAAGGAAMYQAMAMTFWLPQTETALAQMDT